MVTGHSKQFRGMSVSLDNVPHILRCENYTDYNYYFNYLKFPLTFLWVRVQPLSKLKKKSFTFGVEKAQDFCCKLKKYYIFLKQNNDK